MSEFAWTSRRHALAGTVAIASLAACGRKPPEEREMGFSETGVTRLEADLKGHVAQGQPLGLVALAARDDHTRVFPLGAMTSWFNDPARGLTAILLTQRVFDSPDPPQVHKDFWRDAYGALA